MTREVANFLGALFLTVFFGVFGAWSYCHSLSLGGEDRADEAELAFKWGVFISFLGFLCILALLIPAFTALTQCLPSGVAR